MPSYRRNNEKENLRRRNDTKIKRSDKVIIKYIEANHPAIYQEAKECYEKLDKLHPDKIDLTKTDEFKSITKADDSQMDNIQLNIQLLNPAEVQAAQLKAKPVATETTLQVISQSSPAIPPVAAHVTIGQQYEPVTGPELQPVDQETIDQLISDLREDPDVGTFFQDWDFELDDCPLW